MATTVRYEPPSAVEWAKLAFKPEIRAALASIAEQGKGIAVALSQEFTDSGHYSSSFGVEQGQVVLNSHPRPAAMLFNDVAYAANVELRHHVLARTADVLAAFGRA